MWLCHATTCRLHSRHAGYQNINYITGKQWEKANPWESKGSLLLLFQQNNPSITTIQIQLLVSSHKIWTKLKEASIRCQREREENRSEFCNLRTRVFWPNTKSSFVRRATLLLKIGYTFGLDSKASRFAFQNMTSCTKGCSLLLSRDAKWYLNLRLKKKRGIKLPSLSLPSIVVGNLIKLSKSIMLGRNIITYWKAFIIHQRVG